MAEAIFISANY